MTRPMVGISVTDFAAHRGHTAASVYRSVDYIEYGGFAPPGQCEEVAFALAAKASLRFGRHLVSTDLPRNLDHDREADQILADVQGVQCEYFLTDVGFWSLGGQREGNSWPRPCSLDVNIADTVRANCLGLRDRLGVPVLPENPAIIAVRADITMAEFMAHIGRDLDICLDVGHFWAFCRNYDLDPHDEIDKVPLDSVRVIHIAGLSPVLYAGHQRFLDNHDVVPNSACLSLLHDLVARCPRLGWVTYEAELATLEVQEVGLNKVIQACRG